MKANRALNHELEKYQLGLESFGQKQAASDRHEVTARRWWALYGESTPALKAIAVKLLDQCASNSAAKRNWAYHECIERKKRNHLSVDCAEKTCLHCN